MARPAARADLAGIVHAAAVRGRRASLTDGCAAAGPPFGGSLACIPTGFLTLTPFGFPHPAKPG